MQQEPPSNNANVYLLTGINYYSGCRRNPVQPPQRQLYAILVEILTDQKGLSESGVGVALHRLVVTTVQKTGRTGDKESRTQARRGWRTVSPRPVLRQHLCGGGHALPPGVLSQPAVRPASGHYRRC